MSERGTPQGGAESGRRTCACAGGPRYLRLVRSEGDLAVPLWRWECVDCGGIVTRLVSPDLVAEPGVVRAGRCV